jgi:hypothetical protein
MQRRHSLVGVASTVVLNDPVDGIHGGLASEKNIITSGGNSGDLVMPGIPLRQLKLKAARCNVEAWACRRYRFTCEVPVDSRRESERCECRTENSYTHLRQRFRSWVEGHSHEGTSTGGEAGAKGGAGLRSNACRANVGASGNETLLVDFFDHTGHDA